ncbi:hypothetical protein XI06_14200 [Bradyrhizobium sp. CCBAU 11434]|nr:hypothetical protein [Bradyrhizobium sp. CCBAU 11434]
MAAVNSLVRLIASDLQQLCDLLDGQGCWSINVAGKRTGRGLVMAKQDLLRRLALCPAQSKPLSCRCWIPALLLRRLSHRVQLLSADQEK